MINWRKPYYLAKQKYQIAMIHQRSLAQARKRAYTRGRVNRARAKRKAAYRKAYRKSYNRGYKGGLF